MPIIADILLIVLPVFFVTALGFFLKMTKLVDTSFLNQMNKLIYYVALPALLFHKVAKADFSASFNAYLLLGMMLAVVIAFGVSYGYGLLRGYSPKARGAFCQGAFRGNMAYVGLAIAFNAYGEEGFAIAGIMVGFLLPFYNFLAVLALLIPQPQREHKLGASFWAYQFAFNPIMIASFLGIAWSFFNLSIPFVFDKTLNIVTGMSLPLALIAIGASFSPQKLRGEFLKALLATGIKIVWLPLLTAVILYFIGIRGVDLAIGVIFAGAPTAPGAYIMAQQLNSDAELSASIIMLSTFLSVITISIALYLLKITGI